MTMSGISSTQTVSSILKKNRSLITRDKQVKVRFKVPTNLKEILEDVLNKRNEKPYEQLLFSLRDYEIEDQNLRNLLKEVRKNIYILDKKLERFVEALVSLEWLNRSPETIKEYQGFILDLVPAYNYYTNFILVRLIKYFYFSKDSNPWINSLPTEEEETIYENIHYLFRNILELVPLFYHIVDEVVVGNLKLYNKTAHNHECYIHNMLQMCKYKPLSRLRFLTAIIKLLNELDIHSPKQQLLDANEDKRQTESAYMDEASNSVFAMDVDVENKTNVKPYIEHKFGKNLDCLMNYLFAYIQREYAVYDSENNIREWKLFDDFKVCFDNIILPTYQTEHAQFLLFYICSLKNTFAERFLLFLWEKITQPTNYSSPILRLTSTHYLGSFLARANYIPISTLIIYIKRMADWIHEYIANKDDQEGVRVRDRIFYYVCQNFFYIITFRHKDLVNSKKNKIFLQSLNLGEIVNSKLNPFLYCQKGIVNNFASFTAKYHLAYLHLKIHENSRNHIPVEYKIEMDQPGYGADMNVDTHFPFDPYMLNGSLHWIEPLFRSYEPAEPEEDVHVSERESTSNEEEDDFLMATCSPTSPTLNSTAIELFSYSTSPPFCKKNR